MNIDERIAARRAALQKRLDAIPDDGTLPLSTTFDARAALQADRVQVGREIADLNTKVDTWAALPTPDADVKWLAHLNAWRTTIGDERLTIKSPIRDRDIKERAQRLEWTIKLIDKGLSIGSFPIITLSASPIGPLMAAAGYVTEGPALHGANGFLGGIEDVEQRIKNTTKHRAAAQAALASVLLTDDERAAKAAEDKVFYATINTMRCRVSSDGKSLIAETLDGDPLDVADMTPEQRTALERFEAAHFGRPRETVSS